MTLPDPIAYAVPVFIALIFAEMLVARAKDRRRYCPRDTLNSLLLGLGSTVAGAASAGLIFALATWLFQFRLFDIGYVWWAWPLCFVLDDLAYYAFHRSAHRVRWFWASHVNHHSSQHYNLSTALRQTWTGTIGGSFVFALPIVLLGFPPALVIFCRALNLIYQFWIHTEVVGRCPRWFEAVMNTPSHHRVHHATNARYLDRNYAGVFIVWDRMFGSFTPERDDERIRYGLVNQLSGFNLLRSAFHEWLAIARDIATRPVASWPGYLFGPPGWSHDGSRDTSDMIRRRWEEAQDWKTMTSSSSAADREAALSPDASAKVAATASS